MEVRKRFPAFELGPLSLDLLPGTVVGLLGPNGAGKTTLLNVIALQSRLTSGEMTYGGARVAWGDARWKSRISYIRETPAFYDELTVRETLKGTFGWLRTLPISDRELVAAKFLTTSGCCTALWVITSLPFSAGYFSQGRAGTWMVLLLSLIAFGALSVAVRWRFNQKFGTIAPLVIVLVPVLVLIAAGRENADAIRALSGFWNSPAGKAAVAALLGGFSILLFLLTAEWVRRSDAFRLLE